jgi:lipoprotein-anchoring transpeptidase ErfK/SrfK
MTKNKKLALWSIISVLLLILIAAGILFSYQKAYAGKIYPNISFGGIDLSGKTKQEAQTTLEEKFQSALDKEIVLTANGATAKAKLADTGLTFDFNNIINQGYAVGRDTNFFRNMLSSTKTVYQKNEIEVTPYLDQTKYNTFVQIVVDQLNTKPEDATLQINNGEIKTTTSKVGQTVDTANLVDEIIATINNDTDTIELQTTLAYPTVENADFAPAQSKAQAYLDKKITFTYDTKSYSPSRSEIGAWLDFTAINDVYDVNLNQNNIKAYLNKIAVNFEVKKVDRKINSLTNEVITEGVQGVYLDKDQTLKTLLAAIGGQTVAVAMTVTTEDPAEIKVIPAEGIIPGKFSGKYIDVDLTNQKLCQVEGNAVIACHVISSGKASTPTPTGTFAIQNKDPRRWSNASSLWMPWWEQFADGGYGIHELPEWPNGYKEGQAHLGTPVSHGCVRLGIGEAEQVYNWTDIGTPVYIHN